MPTYETLLEAIPTPVQILDMVNPDSLWLFFGSPEDRAAARTVLVGEFIELEDRSVQLNYVNDWFDVAGYALMVAHAPVWPLLRRPA